ncbi:ABC transporter permease [Paenibacillus sp. GSMTC-2017]|uniref:ABC transporter permease n=1 Tax=Paenibacillus sp. GSMTC-2017 TaxID=2794350 RepID=UPI0018D99767|nr:FtsX-like permease family protein [Paenibacillus sp. GSMTC-2017]MBH5317703.1 ABC transporter permease [Paenibacillus sp. GSMTC-2017]
MNIVNKLTIRHLKQNKRRTLVTMIGVIISVAMVTAVVTLGVSFLDLMKKQSIADNGEWHVLYKDVNKDQLEAIQKDGETKSVVITKDRGYAPLAGSQNVNKPYLFIKEYNDQGFEQFPIELNRGRFPQAENEVVLSEEIASNAKVEYKIGDRLTLEVGQRIYTNSSGEEQLLDQNIGLNTDSIDETLKNKITASYTVVGFIKRPIWEPTWAPGYTVVTYVDESLIEANETVDASVVLKNVKKSLYTHAETLAKENNIDIKSINYNKSLLRYYGVTNNDRLQATLFSLSAIIMGVIVVGSVSLIYNAFAISVSERSRHLGMLSSVGATKRQKRNSVFFEGAIIGAISIPIGIVCGLIGISITFSFINSTIKGAMGVTEKLSLVVTPYSILIACAVSILTIFISTYIPAMRASKISAIDAIRQSIDIKLTGKVVKTSKFIRKLFGIEAEIGLKNLKRNKRRYQATVFSLVISIVLFLAVSYFTDNMKKSLELSQSGVNFDIQVSTGSGEISDRVLNAITSLDDITEYSVTKQISMNAWIPEAEIAKELQEQVKVDPNLLNNGKYQYFITFHALDHKNLQAYAKQVGADYNQLIDPDPKNLSAIVIDTVPYEDAVAGKYVETKMVHKKLGDHLDLFVKEGEAGLETKLKKVKIAQLTDQFPMGVSSGGLGDITIIGSEQVMNQLIEDMNNAHSYLKLYLKSDDPMATQQEIEEMEESHMNVYNVFQGRQQEEQMIFLMSVFTYGFILLITAISVANIFNTISTSITLRKREFAMLKSVGMTPKGFNKMMNYESIFYGIKSLLYGLPISVVVMYLIHKSLMNSFSYQFALPWISIIYVIVAVFVIVTSAMLYSSSKVKKENIIDALKQESI